jgi:hypothetical protein
MFALNVFVLSCILQDGFIFEKINYRFYGFSRPLHGHEVTGCLKTPENSPRNAVFESSGGRP